MAFEKSHLYSTDDNPLNSVHSLIALKQKLKIADLEKGCFAFNTQAAQAIQKLNLVNWKPGDIIVLEADQQIVSIVRFGIATARLVSIGGTYTFPAYRRKGFAERILKFAVNQIVATGRIAHLIVDVDNTPAVTLYRQMGFECVESSYIAYPEYL
nr:GNAT family N-acetyltransferase [Acinetobacter baumannii]